MWYLPQQRLQLEFCHRLTVRSATSPRFALANRLRSALGLPSHQVEPTQHSLITLAVTSVPQLAQHWGESLGLNSQVFLRTPYRFDNRDPFQVYAVYACEVDCSDAATPLGLTHRTNCSSCASTEIGRCRLFSITI